ncbi:hypothetical protein M0R04_08260 [Candidatus Dojkabacteria bacterium]|jgi:hypothetical protein|nr:hypothetical protein [Candidatus Dojkabacteria bacterium]
MSIIIRRCSYPHRVNILGFKWFKKNTKYHIKWFSATHGLCSRHLQEGIKNLSEIYKGDRK